MKILHRNPSLKPGGVNELAVDLPRGMQARGTTNALMSPACDLIGRLTSAQVDHITCRAGGWYSRLAAAKRVRREICSTKPDILQVYTPEAALIAKLACRNIKPKLRPLVVGVVTGFITGRWERWAMRSCDALVFISKYLRNTLTKRGTFPPGAKTWVIPYGVDERLCFPGYSPSANWLEQWRQTQMPRGHSYTICVPAPITPLHGLEDLAPILTTLMHHGLSPIAYLVGDSRKSDPDYLESLRSLFANAQLDERIIWLGARPDLRDVLCACDVALYLSRRPESYNRPILEALSLGRPVLAYDHGVMRELLDSFLPEGRVEPGATKTIAENLLQWHTYRPSMPGEIPYPFRLKDTVESYLTIYSDLLSHRAAASHSSGRKATPADTRTSTGTDTRTGSAESRTGNPPRESLLDFEAVRAPKDPPPVKRPLL